MVNKMQKTTAIALAALSATTITMSTKAIGAEKLEVMEGTINSIYSYKNGTYLFDGYRSEENHSSGYYFDGEKDIEVDTVDSDIFSYAGKYVSFGNDETLFNLETGEVEEENDEDKKVFMEHKFKVKASKAEKYEALDKIYLNDEKQLKNICYGDEWFEYRIAGNAEGKGRTFLTYLSSNEQHLDASEGLGIIVHQKQEDGSVKKIELNKIKDVSSNGYVIEDQKTVFSTKDYIYRFIKIKQNKEESDDNNTTAYLQRISKEQGKMKKGIYQPKSIISYEINEDDMIMELLENYDDNQYVFFDTEDSIYAGYFNGSEFNIEKYNLKKVKESRLDKRKLEFDEKMKYKNVQDITQDCNADLWVLSKGKVSKFVNDDLEDRYLVDRSLNRISVYNDNNLSVWNTENDIYSIVSEEEKIVEDSLGKDETSNNGQGWSKNEEGKTIFIDETGKIYTGWLKDKDNWYYMNENGIMHSGWLKDNGSWYYLQEDGIMKTGWFKDSNGKWYYLKANGSMACNESIDGYTLGPNGAWIN